MTFKICLISNGVKDFSFLSHSNGVWTLERPLTLSVLGGRVLARHLSRVGRMKKNGRVRAWARIGRERESLPFWFFKKKPPDVQIVFFLSLTCSLMEWYLSYCVSTSSSSSSSSSSSDCRKLSMTFLSGWSLSRFCLKSCFKREKKRQNVILIQIQKFFRNRDGTCWVKKFLPLVKKVRNQRLRLKS